MDSVQAAILNPKLKKLDEWNDRRIKSAALYTELLQNIGDIRTPITAPNNKHVFHIYAIRTQYRDQLQQYLKENGVPTQIHYPVPIHRQKCYRHEDFYNSDQFPVTDKLSKEILSLPMHPYLTETEIDYIVDTIHDFFSNSSHKSTGWWQ
jgi:dTDP-4-amino-4,6-dideoxygalactose transaminase